MSLRGTIVYKNSPEATTRELKRAAKAELAEVPQHWHEKYLPGHFKRENMSKYKMKERSESHNRRKRKLYGHSDPLVFTGDMKREVSRQIKVTSTSKGARGVLRGPRYLYQRRKKYNQPDKAAEIVYATVPEVRDMSEFLDRRITARLNGMNKSETKRL